MTKKTLTTEKVLVAWNVLAGAKYTKLDAKEKIAVWKASRQLKPTAEQFDADTKDAYEKMKPTDDWDARAEKAQEYQNMTRQKDFDAGKLPMGPAEYAQFMTEFQRYQRVVGDSVADLGKKEVELELETVSEDSLARLMDSNPDWTLAQVMAVADVVCE